MTQRASYNKKMIKINKTADGLTSVNLMGVKSILDLFVTNKEKN